MSLKSSIDSSPFEHSELSIAAFAAAEFAHDGDRYLASELLATSRELGWPNLSAELRSHRQGTMAGRSAQEVELMLVLRGRTRITRKSGEGEHIADAAPGMLWLTPAGSHEDLIELASPLAEVLHVFLPAAQFSSRALGGRGYRGDMEGLRHESGFRDALLESVLGSLLLEMQAPTRHGALLADGLACTLAARLIHRYAGQDADDSRSAGRGLDPRRLKRVREFIDANLERELHLDQLAQVACLSQYHFAREFKKATGRTVHEYLTVSRLERAKELLAANESSIAEIALQCSFSSQASFTKAFVRSLGISPGRYRRNRAGPCASGYSQCSRANPAQSTARATKRFAAQALTIVFAANTENQTAHISSRS